ncbi:MAG: glutamate--tRNA ligase [Candidatus Eremiobacteraeota bacterium]|nr:glutamate--tRNA ligase [Candidatus Eremiobacteraeota bacterium]
MPVRVRFAPSPTGFLHVGGARTALFNWLFARSMRGVFILRVEDTDVARERPEFRAEIFNALKWLGLDWDEGPLVGGAFGPYTQRERFTLYEEAKRRLVEGGFVYPCFCSTLEEDEQPRVQDDEPLDSYSKAGSCRCFELSADQISKKTEHLGAEPALRFRVDAKATHEVRDLVRGHVTFPPGEVEDFIITKAGGGPLYNFAAVVDDALMQISHVIRGEEHLSNTPKQILLYRALGYEPPQFAHLPILLNNERKKLSKRDGATAVGDYRRLGYLSKALVNFLALLGWSPGEDREILSIDEMVALFDLERVQKHGAVFDTVKLTWMNGEYIKASKIDAVVDGVLELIELEPDVADLRTDRWHVTAVCTLLQERAKTLAEIIKGNKYFFSREHALAWDPEAVRKRAGTPESHGRLASAHEALRALDDWTLADCERAIRALAEREGAKAAEYIQPLRVAVTGYAVSPGIFETIDVLGRDMTLGRVAAFLKAHPAGLTAAATP